MAPLRSIPFSRGLSYRCLLSSPSHCCRLGVEGANAPLSRRRPRPSPRYLIKLRGRGLIPKHVDLSSSPSPISLPPPVSYFSPLPFARNHLRNALFGGGGEGCNAVIVRATNSCQLPATLPASPRLFSRASCDHVSLWSEMFAFGLAE